MARMPNELNSLQYLVLVLHILLTEGHGFKSSQHLKDTSDKRNYSMIAPPECHHDQIPLEPVEKATVQKADFGEHIQRRPEEAAYTSLLSAAIS